MMTATDETTELPTRPPAHEVAPWIKRGDKLPTEAAPFDLHKPLQDEAIELALDPVRTMADFYVSEYVEAVLSLFHRYGTDPWNDGSRSAHLLKRDAKRLQNHIVAKCDPLFRDYLFLAIGGEVRHHGCVNGQKALCPVMGAKPRTHAWGWWTALAEANNNHAQLAQDCDDLFSDSWWGGGFGGERWAIIARTLRQRLDGTTDARTFVDRVFSLQHNGGSALNKISWPSLATIGGFGKYKGDITQPHHCMVIGEAHANLGAIVPAQHGLPEVNHFATLREVVSPDAADLIGRLWEECGYALPSDHRYPLGSALGHIEQQKDTDAPVVSDLPTYGETHGYGSKCHGKHTQHFNWIKVGPPHSDIYFCNYCRKAINCA